MGTHSLIPVNRGDVVVDRRRVLGLVVLMQKQSRYDKHKQRSLDLERITTYRDDARLEVVVDLDLGDYRRADVREVEVARLLAQARPARRALPVDLHRRRAVPAQVQHVEAHRGVRRQHRVLARDERHRERQRPARGRRDLLEVRRERPVVLHVEHRDEPGRRRHALDGRHKLLAVLAEDDVRRRARGARRGRRLVQLERAYRVRDRLEPGLLVDGEARDAVHGAAVERAEARAVRVERERHRELAPGQDGVADQRDLRRGLGVDREEGYGVRARLEEDLVSYGVRGI